jgi:putative sterol carrier protein
MKKQKPLKSIKEYFLTLNERFQPTAAIGIEAVIQFDFTSDGNGLHHVILTEDGFTVLEGKHSSPTVIISSKGETHLKLVNGEMSGMSAYLRGKLKVNGSRMIAQKLQAIFPPNHRERKSNLIV